MSGAKASSGEGRLSGHVSRLARVMEASASRLRAHADAVRSGDGAGAATFDTTASALDEAATTLRLETIAALASTMVPSLRGLGVATGKLEEATARLEGAAQVVAVSAKLLAAGAAIAAAVVNPSALPSTLEAIDAAVREIASAADQ